MTVEADIYTLLRGLVGDKVYPDTAPLGTPPPYIVYQQVGGRTLQYLGREVPNKKNGRFQVSGWAGTRKAASALQLAIENAFMTATTFQAEPLGSPVATSADELPLKGSRQDFSIWSDR